jgi:hypothetical protein
MSDDDRRDSGRPMSRDASRILAEQFAKGLETTSTLLHGLQTEVHASAVTLAGLKIEVSGMKTEVDGLSRIIRDGNGERSVVARLLMLEKNIESINGFIAEMKKEEQESDKIERSGKWELRIALAAGMLGLIGTIVNAIFH